MAKLKVYTLGINGFVNPAVIEAIGDRPHIRQASVHIIAASQAEAVRVADEVGLQSFPGSREFRQIASTNWTDSVLSWADRPMVLAKSMHNFSGNPVVEIEGRDQVRRVGSVVQVDHRVPIFVPDGV